MFSSLAPPFSSYNSAHFLPFPLSSALLRLLSFLLLSLLPLLLCSCLLFFRAFLCVLFFFSSDNGKVPLAGSLPVFCRFDSCRYYFVPPLSPLPSFSLSSRGLVPIPLFCVPVFLTPFLHFFYPFPFILIFSCCSHVFYPAH